MVGCCLSFLSRQRVSCRNVVEVDTDFVLLSSGHLLQTKRQPEVRIQQVIMRPQLRKEHARRQRRDSRCLLFDRPRYVMNVP